MNITDIINNTQCILFMCNENGKILVQEGGGLKGYNMTRNQDVGKDVFETYQNLPEFLDALRITIDTGKVTQSVYIRDNGYCETIFNKCENGNIIGICTKQSDRISREKEIHNLEIEYTKREAQEDLLAVFSHEMRNPLSSIINIIHLLKDEDIDADYLNALFETSNIMLNMLNNLLDNSKFKKGFMKIDINSFNINNSIEDTIAVFKYNIKNVEILYNKKNEYSQIYCLGDKVKIKQILINFISNSLKFSDNNTIIDINLDIKDNFVTFSVTDKGPGISIENQKKLFKEYTQLSGSYGTGLGLHICKQISDLLKGEIGCYSKINKGSTFWFKIPLEMSKSNFEKHLLGSWIIN